MEVEILKAVEKRRKRNTKQKAVILHVVENSHDHPTAETVYERARKELPSISLGTVYRVLKELVREGRIREIVIGKQSHFDRRTDFHHHFVCRECGKIEDIETPLCKYTCKKVEQKGYVVEEIEYKFYGLCDKCASKKCS